MKVFRSIILVLAFQGSTVFAAGPQEILYRCQSLIINLGLTKPTNFFGNPLKKLTAEDDPHSESETGPFGLTGTFYESHKVQIGEQSWLNKIVADVEAEGGDVRIVQAKGLFVSRSTKDNSAFAFNTETRLPRLMMGWDAPREYVEHEYQHFLDWRELKYDFIRAGVPREEAAMRASQVLISGPQQFYLTEQRAVERELTINRQTRTKTQTAMVVRAAYPELGASIQWLTQLKVTKKKPRNKDMLILDDYMTQAIWRAAHQRRAKIDELKSKSPFSFTAINSMDSIPNLRNVLTIADDLDIPGRYNELEPRYNKIMLREMAKLIEYLED